MKKIRVTKYVSLRRDASATASPPCQALGAALDSVAAMLRGDPGTVVRLDVSRGGKAMAFPLSRAQFKVFFFVLFLLLVVMVTSLSLALQGCVTERCPIRHFAEDLHFHKQIY